MPSFIGFADHSLRSCALILSKCYKSSGSDKTYWISRSINELHDWLRQTHFVRWSKYCLISFALVDFWHTSPPKEMKVPQHKHSLIEQSSFEASGGWSVSLYVQLHPAVTTSQPSSQLKMCVRVASASVALIVTDNIFNQHFCLCWRLMLILSGSNSRLHTYSPIKFYSCASAFPHEV